MSEARWTLWRRGPLYAWQLNPSVKTWTEKDEPEEITVMRVSEHEAIMEDAKLLDDEGNGDPEEPPSTKPAVPCVPPGSDPKDDVGSDHVPRQTTNPQKVDTSADVERAARSVSVELATKIRDRQEALADKRRRAQLDQGLLQRRVQGRADR